MRALSIRNPLNDSAFVPTSAEQTSAGPELGVTVCRLTASPLVYLDSIFLSAAATEDLHLPRCVRRSAQQSTDNFKNDNIGLGPQ